MLHIKLFMYLNILIMKKEGESLKKLLVFALMIALTFSVVGCEEMTVTGERLGVAYYNAHNGAIATAAAVVDADGKILAAYLDDVFLVDLNQGYEGLPAVDSNRVTDYLANPAYTLASKKYKVNSDIYGASMASKAGSTVLPADNLTKIQQFAVGKTIAELEAVMAKSSVDAKEEIQAASGATFADNQRYLNTIVLAAKNAQKTYNTFNANNPVLKQAYYNTHGAPGLAYVVLEGDKVVASYVDEFYFFDSNTTDVVFQMDAAKSIPAFKANKGLSSKKTNGSKYGITLKGGIYVDQIAAIESFINGKTVAELKQSVETLSAEGAVVADVVSGATIRDTKDYIKAVIIAADPSQAAGDAKAQVVKQVGMVSMGLGHVTSIAKSKDLAADVLPAAEVNTTFVGAGFDKDGKVVKVVIDHAQQKMNFDKDLQITTDLTAEQITKIELGDGYGMKAASTIGKNWHEQIPELEKWMVGKTIDEIKAMKQTETSVPDVPELTSSVTIKVADYIAAIEEAYNNRIEIKQGAVKLGIGSAIDFNKSKNADVANKVTALAQVNTEMTVTAFDSTGKVVGNIYDVLEAKVKFDADGKVTNKADAQETKQELAERYGMGAGPVSGKHWFEQVNAFSKWTVGKTVKDINALPLLEGGYVDASKADLADLASSVTVHVNSFIPVIEESFTTAK